MLQCCIRMEWIGRMAGKLVSAASSIFSLLIPSIKLRYIKFFLFFNVLSIVTGNKEIEKLLNCTCWQRTERRESLTIQINEGFFLGITFWIHYTKQQHSRWERSLEARYLAAFKLLKTCLEHIKKTEWQRAISKEMPTKLQSSAAPRCLMTNIERLATRFQLYVNYN